MNLPVWLKPALVGAGVGAVALAVIGFTAGGWVTSKKAETMASALARSQTVAALVPYCVAEAKADPNGQAIMLKLKDASQYSRGSIVQEAGWATQRGENQPNRGLASACADQLASSM